MFNSTTTSIFHGYEDHNQQKKTIEMIMKSLKVTPSVPPIFEKKKWNYILFAPKNKCRKVGD